nr:GNAT family N-acetyltransferase [Halobacillus locisalis]
MLDEFVRYQRTEKVIAKANGKFVERTDEFEDDWTIEDKRRIVEHFSKVIENGGSVVVAEIDYKVIGFSVIEADSFDEYRELSYIHVSAPYRGMGVGKELMDETKKQAIILGEEKLYIGAHPSIDTQAFYKRAGCVPAEKINQSIYEREPRDVQLELSLK